MAEDIIVLGETKEENYSSLLLQIKGLINGEEDVIANMANICAALKFGMNFFWVGFYIVKNDILVLGPFQGPVACTRIQKGKGVCGTAWDKNEVIIVDDVDLFPGHIACSSQSKSEIVIPITNKQNEVVAVLDIDSDLYSRFNKIDAKYLSELTQMLVF